MLNFHEKPQLKCTSCTRFKDHDEFYVHKSNTYNHGRSYSCKECIRKRNAENHKTRQAVKKKRKRPGDAEDFWNINEDAIYM